MTISLIDWMDKNNVENPHAIPSDLKEEFNLLFKDTNILWPQPGGQVEFQNCPADIVLYGGEAGAGKSFNILLDIAKWVHLPDFIATIVRKTYTQIFDAGGLWNEAKQVFGPLGGEQKLGRNPKFVFPSGAQVYFKHSQHESHVEKLWQGLQSAVIAVDELTHFTKDEFLYFMSRNRLKCGVNSYMRMTCNPDPLSWVKKLVQWWIDDKGYVVPERSGVIRYFTHKKNQFIFGDTKEELFEKFGKECSVKSFTFIRGYLDENQKLLEKDPGYKASLDNLSQSQRKALREGNWNEVDNPDAMFSMKNINAHRVESVDFESLSRIVVGIDPAGGDKKENDETGIVAGGIADNGHVYIFHDKTGRYKPIGWAGAACDLYDLYKAECIIAERNYGGDMVESTIRSFRPDIYPRMVTATRGKAVRAEPVAMLYEKGMVHHVGHGLDELENEMSDFTPNPKKSPNRLDALVWVITELALKPQHVPSIRML